MKKIYVFVCVVMVSLLMAGCRSAVSNHTYLLTPDETLQAQPEAKVRVRVMSISLPVYLSRRELVRLVDGDELTMVSGIMLAETLDSGVRNVLSENLERLSVPGGTMRSVRFDFRHLELTDHGTVRVEVLVSTDGISESPKTIAFETPLAGQAHVVRAYSVALAELSRQVMQWLCAVQR